MKARLALVGSATALLLIPTAPAEAHVVTCASSRLYAAERVVILKNSARRSGATVTARLGTCVAGPADHAVTWNWTLTLTIPRVRTIRCTATFDVYAKASGVPGNPLTDHPTVLGYRHKSRSCA
jgi:hypothetical protein